MFGCENVTQCSSTATVRVRLQGEQTPELLLELQDDVHTQSFLQHVTKAKQQGDTPAQDAATNIKPHFLFINHSNHLFTRVTNTQIYRFVIMNASWKNLTLVSDRTFES